MNNQKETVREKRQGISRKKVVVATVMVIAVFVVGSYLYVSGRARGFLEQGSAIALKSFEEIFQPSATGTIVSEVDLASSSESDTTNTEFSKSSSVGNGTSTEKQNGDPASSESTKENETAAVNKTTTKNNAHDILGRATSTTSAASSETTLPDSSVGKNSLIDTSTGTGKVSSSSGLNAINATEISNCSFPASVPENISHRVILNEIAWMGAPSSTGETAAAAANREWIELKNISGGEISLDGWRIMDATEGIKISFGSGDLIAANGLYLLSRGGSAVSGVSADKAYTGTLSNSGDKLAVLDTTCSVSDFLDASAKWPGGSNTTKQTLERTATLGWQTSSVVGGTPRVENSAGMPIKSITSSSTEKYTVNIAIAGDGGGKITIKPGSTVCKTMCTNEYVAGTAVTLTATPGAAAEFSGWSGGCSGASACSFVIMGPVSVVADFRANVDSSLAVNEATPMADTADVTSTADATDNAIIVATTTDTAAETSTAVVVDAADTSNTTDTADATVVIGQTPSSSVSLPASVNHLVIAAIQIAGASSGDDSVKIYNPTPLGVDIGGWKLRKKSSTGTDSSIREFPKGNTVAPGGYFMWASSANGFAASIGADASSTETLAANNSVAIFDGNGAQVDAVAWGIGTNQYVEGSPYPESPPANQVLQRKFADGAVVDTDNNANDFTL